MDSTVSIGEPDSLMTESAPTPAGLAAREEYAKILNDPTHPHHDGLKRNSKAANDYVTELYRKAYSNAPAPIEDRHSVTTGGPIEPQPGETPEDAENRARNEVILTPLRQEWGEQYEARFSGARAVAQQLFGDEGWGDVLDDLGTAIRTHYGPAGETAALRFLAALAEHKI